MIDLDAYIQRLKAQPDLVEVLAPLFDLIEQQAQRIQALEVEVATLTARLAQDSTNSHKPPASDSPWLKPKPAFPRAKGRPRGGKPGHSGDTLHMSPTPDHTHLLAPERCPCGHALEGLPVTVAERRQVYDLPPPRLEVTEYQRGRCACPACGRDVEAEFPEAVRAPVQYGDRAQALAVLLGTSYKLSQASISRLFGDLFGQPINVATVQQAHHRCFEHLAESQEAIRTALAEARVVHFDETGLRVEGRLHWLHSASDARYTDLLVHPKRGTAAMDEGVLAQFASTPETPRWAVHDGYASYFTYDGCQHALCGAHLLRELRAVAERGSVWARHMHRCLMALYRMSDHGRSRLPEDQHAKARRLYRRILADGEHEEPPPEQQARGRPQGTPGRNLVRRLRKHESSVLAFAFESAVPFTNNQAERDVRPAKVKQKVSGCFRTLLGSQVYARIEGFVSTARKQERSVFAELCAAFGGQTFLTAPLPS